MADTQATQNKEKSSITRLRTVKDSHLRRKCACGMHSGAEREDPSLQGKSYLQRTCACGQHTIAGSTCTSCRQQRTSGAESDWDHETTSGERERSGEYPHYGRDFTLVQASVPSPSRTMAGGEGAGDDETESLVGAEFGPLTQTVSQRIGHRVQRQDEEAAVKLNYTTITAPHSLGCGGFNSQVRWGLDGATAETNGFVVQKVTFDLDRERSDGGDNSFQATYWEAWEVRGGDIFVGTSDSRHRADTFNVGPAPDNRGSCFEAGWATFMPNYEAPRGWGNVPMALALPSTYDKPAEWSEANTLFRYMRNTFDCFEQSDMGDFESSG